MARGKKKKKEKTETQEEEKEDLLTYFASLGTVIIYGKEYQRIRYDGVKSKNCPGCHVQKDCLHDVACHFEICAHCGFSSWGCNCDPDIQNFEKDCHIKSSPEGSEE